MIYGRTSHAAALSLAILVASSLAATPALGQENPYPLEGLVVTASPTPRPQGALATNVTVLDGARLRSEGFTRVQEALRIVPGLDVVQSGSVGAYTSLFMRGGESNYVLLLLDGVQMNQPGGAVDLSSLTLDNVERIEIVRGPQSPLYGSDAVAGVIQILTRRGQGPSRASLTTRAGSFGRQDLAVDAWGGTDRAGYSVGLSRLRTRGTLPFNNGYTDDVVDGAFHVMPGAHTRVRFTGRLSHHTYHFPTDGSGNVVDTNAFTHGDEETLGLESVHDWGRAFDVRLSMASYGLDGGTDDAQDGPADTLGFYASTSRDHVRRASVNVRGNVRLGGLVGTLGWELERESQRSSTESSSQYGPSSDESENTRWNRGTYAHLSGTRGWLSFGGGARLEDNERFGRLWTWQAGAVAHPRGAGGPALRASLGTGIKEPTFYENYATGFARGNPDLGPERSRSWEVGLDAPLADGLVVLRGTYFRQSFRDLIQYTFTTPTPEAPNFYNVARARAHGVELAVEGGMGPVRASASWTRLATHVVDPGVDQGPGDEFAPGQELLRRPRQSAGVELTGDVGDGISVTGSLDMVGPRADRDFTTFPATRVVLGRYTLLSLGASWSLLRSDGGPRVDLSVRGENLLDRSYQEVFGFSAPRRAFYVGARVGVGGGRP